MLESTILNTFSPRKQQAKTPSFLAQALNRFQAWALQNPDNYLSKVFLPIISFVEGILANNPTYLDSKRLAFGPNFCCSGQVVMGEFKTIEAALTSPQARTWRLGTSILDPNHAPNQDVGGRNVFLLSLSDKESSGSSDHENFRKCMQKYLLNDAATERQRDVITRRLLEQLGADYVDMPDGTNKDFFTNDKRGWMGFVLRYMHYILFGLDPNDDESVSLLTELHYTRLGTLHYFAGSSLLQSLNLKGHGNLPDLIEQAATIYENSPALADFEEDSSQDNVMTRRELAKLMTSIMSIAALQGPLHLGYTAMGYRTLPAYQGRQTSAIDPTDCWDKLDFNDRESVRLYLLECARLWPPVSATHRVAIKPFTTTVAGMKRTFPTGTKVLIPMILGLLDESFWGPTAYEFNAKRENLCPFHMGFNSVGNRSAGRICPGKDIALEMLVNVVITVGKVRRSSNEQKFSASAKGSEAPPCSQVVSTTMLIKKKQLKDIVTWMKVKHPTELPEVLQGIFFMDGNGLPDDCLTMYGSEWNADTLTLLLPVFAPVRWTFHSSTAGRILLHLVRFSRLTYSIRFSNETLQRAHITPILFRWYVPQWIVDFLMDRDESNPNGDIWHRKNSWFRRPPNGGYTLRRIVDKDGKDTPAFQDMLSKVDNDCLIIVKDS